MKLSMKVSVQTSIKRCIAMERNSRLAHSRNITLGVFSCFRCKIWRHILARRPRIPTKVTKFCACIT